MELVLFHCCVFFFDFFGRPSFLPHQTPKWFWDGDTLERFLSILSGLVVLLFLWRKERKTSLMNIDQRRRGGRWEAIKASYMRQQTKK